jgi:hypothetical protein
MVSSKREKAGAPVSLADIFANRTQFGGQDDLGGVIAIPSQGVLGPGLKVGRFEPGWNDLTNQIVFTPSGFTRGPECGEETINPATGGRPLVAGGLGRGEMLWRISQRFLSFQVRDLGANEFVENFFLCTRCWGFLPGRLLSCSKRLVNHRSRWEWQGARESGEGEPVGRLLLREPDETVNDILRNIAPVHGNFALKSSRANGMRETLQLIGTIPPTPEGEGLLVPSVNVPRAYERVPSSMYQTGPAGCPDLLFRRHIASTVSGPTCSFTGGRGSLLRGMALYK